MSYTTNEILRHFAAVDEVADCRPELAQPWRKGDWVYATEGHILIRCPARYAPEIEERPETKDIEALDINWGLPMHGKSTMLNPSHHKPALCEFCKGAGELIPCPVCKDKDDKDDCPFCMGYAAIGGRGEDAWLCPSCDGLGFEDDLGSDSVTLEGRQLLGWAVRKVLEVLPGAWWRRDGEHAHFAMGVFMGVCLVQEVDG